MREAAQILGISERKVMDMIDSKELQAYKIANQFLRLKRSEVAAVKRSGSVESETVQHPYTANEQVQDFFYYNDFYIIALVLIAVLVYLVLHV